MAPVMQYVFAAMRSRTEHFTAGSHEWLPYSKNAMRTKSPNTNLSFSRQLPQAFFIFLFNSEKKRQYSASEVLQ